MNERLIATRTHAYVVAGSVAKAWKAQQAYMHGMRTCTATCTGNIWLGHVRLPARSAVTKTRLQTRERLAGACYTKHACPEFPTGACAPTCASTTSRHAWQRALQRHWWRQPNSLGSYSKNWNGKLNEKSRRTSNRTSLTKCAGKNHPPSGGPDNMRNTTVHSGDNESECYQFFLVSC